MVVHLRPVARSLYPSPVRRGRSSLISGDLQRDGNPLIDSYVGREPSPPSPEVGNHRGRSSRAAFLLAALLAAGCLLAAYFVAPVVGDGVAAFVGKDSGVLPAPLGSPTDEGGMAPDSVTPGGSDLDDDDEPTLSNGDGTGDESPGVLKEGIDYSVRRTEDGSIRRWPCGVDIVVALGQDPPRGAARSVKNAVALIREASSLPLVVAQDSPKGPDIEIFWDVPGTTIRNTTLGAPPVAGIAGVSDTGGAIVEATVIINSRYSPGQEMAQEILTHELAHAVGVGHSAEGTSELMAPVGHTADPTSMLGAGDKKALAIVGCK